MTLVERLENFGVEMAFAEENAWQACPTRQERHKGNDVGKPTSTGDKATRRKQARSRAVLFGILTIGVYAAVFTNTDMVMRLFTKGGINAVLPVAMVFLVSYVHGSFASNFWTALGIEGSAKKTVRKDVPAEKRPAADTRPRLHA
jgi:hypothetical protein